MLRPRELSPGDTPYTWWAGLYDGITAPMEWMGGKRRRRRLLSKARGHILEVGIGTGLNLPVYHEDADVTGIDIAAQMLEMARRRARRLGRPARLELADAQSLPFADATFDTVTATCVFCSIADPLQALREVRRVVKHDGRVLLLEHVRPEGRFLGWLADLVSPWIQRLFGPAINRRTEATVVQAGLHIVEAHRESVWREIVATPAPRSPAE